MGFVGEEKTTHFPKWEIERFNCNLNPQIRQGVLEQQPG
jgi:hypothetical protein